MFNRKKRTIVELERRVRSLEGSLRFAHKEYELKTGDPFPSLLSSIQLRRVHEQWRDSAKEFLSETLLPRMTRGSSDQDA